MAVRLKKIISERPQVDGSIFPFTKNKKGFLTQKPFDCSQAADAPRPKGVFSGGAMSGPSLAAIFSASPATRTVGRHSNKKNGKRDTGKNQKELLLNIFLVVLLLGLEPFLMLDLLLQEKEKLTSFSIAFTSHLVY